MYLIINEDGEITKTEKIEDKDGIMDAVDGGIFDLVDIDDKNNPIYYYKGEWHEIEDLNRGEYGGDIG